MLLQSGLDNGWWADSMECYCHLRNVQDKLFDGKTPCERPFGMPALQRTSNTVLEQWSNITLFLRKTNLDCISSAQKSRQVNFSAMHKTQGESGKGDITIRRH